jgi:hypothetical protein
MSNQERHLINKGKRIGSELRHHEFSQAHSEILHAANASPGSFEHVLTGIREGLRGDHNSLSVERDQLSRVTHINFESQDIYSSKTKHSHADYGRDSENARNRHHLRASGHQVDHGHSGIQRYAEEINHTELKHTHSGHHQTTYDRPDSAHKQENVFGHGLHATVDLVKRVGKELGLSRAATTGAVAAMLEESGGDPTKVGDHGASVGLFQLNFRGGEGTEAGITKQQAKDPEINARIALKYFRDAQHQSSNPVEIAKLAQRAGDRNYLQSVGHHLGEAKNLIGDEFV